MSEAKENLDVKKSDDKEALKQKNEAFVKALAEKLGISDNVPAEGGLYYKADYKAAVFRINYKLDGGDSTKHAGLELVFRRNRIAAARDRMKDNTASHKVDYTFKEGNLYLTLSYCFECGETKGDALMEQKCSRRFMFHRLFGNLGRQDLPYKYEKNEHVTRWFVADCIELDETCASPEAIKEQQINQYVADYLEKIGKYVNELKKAAEEYTKTKDDDRLKEEDDKFADSIWSAVIEGKDAEVIRSIAHSISRDEYHNKDENFDFKEFYKSLEMPKRESYIEQILKEPQGKTEKQKTKKEKTSQMEEKVNYWIYRAESEDLAVVIDNDKFTGDGKEGIVVCYYSESGKAIRLSVKRVNPREIELVSIYLPRLDAKESKENSLCVTLDSLAASENPKKIKEEQFNDIMQGIKKCAHSRNRILFGAPGTGKSYQLKEDVKASGLPEDRVERVTFHPEYSYFDFVGAYKPKMRDERIVYDFVPGPFTRILKKALLNKDKAYLVIIEEINRARVAAVFGDMFQLLDRDEMGESEYGINPSEELKDYLLKEYYEKKRREKENSEVEIAEEKFLAPEDVEKIRIPGNMYIWSTMNSADQGVYPMDTAFKRRWNFEYMGIDKGVGAVKGKCAADWLNLRDHVNALLQKAGINEDKQMGPFFLKGTELEDEESFMKAVKNKVLMYLFEDAAKHKRSSIFHAEGLEMRYSVICEKFENVYRGKNAEESVNPPTASKEMNSALGALFNSVASTSSEDGKSSSDPQ